MKVAIAGTHCSGKSTFVKYLHEKYPDVPVLESTITFPADAYNMISTQLAIMQHRIELERKGASFFTDRSIFDCLAYSMYHFYNGKNVWAFHDIFFKRFNMYLSSRPYDLLIFVDEMFPLEDNGRRPLDEHMQKVIFNMIKGYVITYSTVFGVPVVVIRGSDEERYALVKECIDKLCQSKILK